MNIILTLGSSALVSALVSAIATYLTQKRLLIRKAQLDYESVARKRLYEAIGPLRLQLLLAGVELIRRIPLHPGKAWPMEPNDYYVRSFIYRILKPLAIAQLIEEQMTTADFSVDPSALDLVRFTMAASRTLSGSEVLLNHPDVDWSSESQHIFFHNAKAAATRLIVNEPGSAARILGYGEFASYAPDLYAYSDLSSFADLFAQCKENLAERPILWLRLVAYGHVCKRFLDKYGAQVGIRPLYYPTELLLQQSRDNLIRTRSVEYFRRCEKIWNDGF